MKITIYQNKLKEFESKIEQFNHALTKHNLPWIIITKSEPYLKDECVLLDVEITIPTHDFSLIEGYKYLGCIQEINGYLFYYTNENLSKEIQTSESFCCDHCNIKRRRTTVYVFEDANKQRKVIGSNCVNKYFPVNVEKELYHYAKMVSEVINFFEGDEEFSYHTGSNLFQEFKMCVLSCAFILDQSGVYISGDELSSNSTKSKIQRFQHILHSKQHERSEQDGLFVDKYLEWCRLNQDYYEKIMEYYVSYSATTDFQTNLKHTFLAQLDRIGLIAYGCYEYGKLTNRYTSLDIKESKYLGEIDQKLECEVKLVAVIQNQFQKSNIVIDQNIMKFLDKDENVIIWKTGLREYKLNSTYKLSGKIKDHQEFRGIKQTILTRCKMEPLLLS